MRKRDDRSEFNTQLWWFYRVHYVNRQHALTRQLSKLQLNICIHSMSYPNTSCYKHYASRSLFHCAVCLNRDKRSFIHSFIVCCRLPNKFSQKLYAKRCCIRLNCWIVVYVWMLSLYVLSYTMFVVYVYVVSSPHWKHLLL